MVKTRKRDPAALALAIVAMITGVLAIKRGEAVYLDSLQITGTQAQLFGWLMVAFAGAAFTAFMIGTPRR